MYKDKNTYFFCSLWISEYHTGRLISWNIRFKTEKPVLSRKCSFPLAISRGKLFQCGSRDRDFRHNSNVVKNIPRAYKYFYKHKYLLCLMKIVCQNYTFSDEKIHQLFPNKFSKNA